MTAPAKAKTARKTATPKPPTTANTTRRGNKASKGGPGTPSAGPFASAGPERPDIRYTLMAICGTAQGIEDGEITSADRSAHEWHQLCPIATLHGGKLTICNHEWHEQHPRCWVCKVDLGGEKPEPFDPVERRCLNVEACADRVKTRIESDPRFERYRQYRAEAAVAEGGKPRTERIPHPDRPTSGTCDHCGAATKGGRFVAGHDAKLKGELLRLALDGDAEALAEMLLRPKGWCKDPLRFDPGVVRQADQIVQSVKTDEYLLARSADRQQRHLEEV